MNTPWLPWALGAAWGAAFALPIARRAARVGVAARASVPVRARSHRVAAPGARDHESPHGGRRGPTVSSCEWCGRCAPRRGARGGGAELARELPVALDLLGVAVGAGCTPYLAVEVAARWSPEPLAAAFDQIIRSCTLGLDFESALDTTARATPGCDRWPTRCSPPSVSVCPSDPCSPDWPRKTAPPCAAAAEAHARRIPVRLLFPLVFLVLPAFVLLTVVPGLAAGLGRL